MTTNQQLVYNKFIIIKKEKNMAYAPNKCPMCGESDKWIKVDTDKKGFSVQTLDYLDGEEAGVKSVTLEISGENAYGSEIFHDISGSL